MTPRSIAEGERRARLSIRHGLVSPRPGDQIVSVVEDLVALHSSDPVSVYLSAAARMSTPAMEPVERALYEERTLMRHHAMRRTLWVFTVETARIAHASTTRRLIGPENRRLVRLLTERGGIRRAEKWLENANRDVLTALAGSDGLTTRQLGEVLPELRRPLEMAPGKSYNATASALSRVLRQLGFRGLVVRGRPTGSWVNSQYRWAATEQWHPAGLEGADNNEAAAELARRWLWAFGPAPASDLQWWTGWPAGITRRALVRAGALEVRLGGQQAWLHPDDGAAVSSRRSWVALLPALDPTTMGWKTRDWYLAPEHTPLLFDRNGNGGPTLWSDGRIVGGWVQRRDGRIAYRLLTDVGSAQREAIESAAHRLETLLGTTRFRVRFPAPIQKELLN